MKKERVSIIGGADGPTSVFLLGGKGKISIRNRIERRIRKIRRYFIEKKITCENHSLEEVETYLLQKYDFVKVSPEAVKTSEEYRQMRAAFIEQYAPELLGEYAVRPQMKGRDPEDIKTFIRLCEERTARAMELPESVFDIDMCKYEKIINSNDNVYYALCDWKHYETTNSYMFVKIISSESIKQQTTKLTNISFGDLFSNVEIIFELYLCHEM